MTRGVELRLGWYNYCDTRNLKFRAWTDGRTWNGWECPLFDRQQAEIFMARWRKDLDAYGRNDGGRTRFVGDTLVLSGAAMEDWEIEPEVIDGVTYWRVDGLTWDEVDESW